MQILKTPALRASAYALILIIATGRIAAAQVFVRGTAENGQGLLRARSNECFVVTPEHVAMKAGDRDRIVLVADGRVERLARYESAYGSDVALLRVESERPLACPAEWDEGEGLSDVLRTAREAVLVSMGEDGSTQRRFMRIAAYDDRTVTIRGIDADDRLFQGLSGSRLTVAGLPAGMLLQVDTETGSGIVLRHDHLSDLLNSFFGRAVQQPTTGPVIDVAAATPILDRALASRDMSMQGQVQALEALLAAGFEYGGADLSGIRLSGAALTGGRFGEARFAGTDLRGARATESDMERADLNFTVLRRADFSEARLTAARAGFADADSVLLRNATATRMSFFGASLRNADLRGADLTGANFMMADLRGARLDGANLTDAMFFMAWLDGASFSGATLSNTDMAGAILPNELLTAAQMRGVCTSWDHDAMAGPLFDVRVTERIPSSRFSGGVEYSVLENLNPYGTRQFASRGLSTCAPHPENNPGTFRGKVYPTWSASYDTDLISRAGRRNGWMRRIDTHMRMMMDELRRFHGIELEEGAH